MTKTAENHTLWGRTYLYSTYKGVPSPPPPGVINVQVLMSHNSARFHSHFTKKRNCEEALMLHSYKMYFSLFQFVNFDALTCLTAFVLFNQSSHLNHSKKDCDWLILASFIRVQMHADATSVLKFTLNLSAPRGASDHNAEPQSLRNASYVSSHRSSFVFSCVQLDSGPNFH